MITITDRYVLEDEDYFYCYQDREEGLVQKVDEIREQLKLSASVHSTPDTVKEGPKREASTYRVQVWSHRNPQDLKTVHDHMRTEKGWEVVNHEDG